MANKTDYVELGLACANVCKALDRGMNGKKLDDLSQSVCEAIGELTTWVNPAMHRFDNSPTALMVTEPSRRSRRRSPRRGSGTYSRDLFTQGTIRKQSLLGS